MRWCQRISYMKMMSLKKQITCTYQFAWCFPCCHRNNWSDDMARLGKNQNVGVSRKQEVRGNFYVYEGHLVGSSFRHTLFSWIHVHLSSLMMYNVQHRHMLSLAFLLTVSAHPPHKQIYLYSVLSRCFWMIWNKGWCNSCNSFQLISTSFNPFQKGWIGYLTLLLYAVSVNTVLSQVHKPCVWPHTTHIKHT